MMGWLEKEICSYLNFSLTRIWTYTPQMRGLQEKKHMSPVLEGWAVFGPATQQSFDLSGPQFPHLQSKET